MPHFSQSILVYKKPNHAHKLRYKIQKSLEPAKEIVQIFGLDNGARLYAKTELFPLHLLEMRWSHVQNLSQNLGVEFLDFLEFLKS